MISKDGKDGQSFSVTSSCITSCVFQVSLVPHCAGPYRGHTINATMQTIPQITHKTAVRNSGLFPVSDHCQDVNSTLLNAQI